MARLLLVIMSLFFSISCKKDSGSDKSGPAAIIAEGSNYVKVWIDNQHDQWVVLTFDNELKGSVIEFPAGSLSASASILFYMDEAILGDNKLRQSLGLEDDVVPSSRRPTLLIEPAVSAGQAVKLNSELAWTLQNVDDIDEWSLLALIDNEDGRRDLTWLGQDSKLESASLKFRLNAFGSYHPIKSTYVPEASVLAAASSGSWWGYELDLFAAGVNPEAQAVSIWEFLVDKEGHGLRLWIDGDDVSPLPGLSFEIAETDHPHIYDSSDEEALGPWLLSRRSLNGVLFTVADSPVPQLTVRVMQRHVWPDLDLPADFELEQLLGTYSGLAVEYESNNGFPVPELDLPRDAVLISRDGTNLRLTGRLANRQDLDFEFSTPAADSAARQLGIMRSSNVSNDMILTIFFALDRRSVGYVLCHQSSAATCGNGEGGGSLDPFQMSYGLLELDP